LWLQRWGVEVCLAIRVRFGAEGVGVGFGAVRFQSNNRRATTPFA